MKVQGYFHIVVRAFRLLAVIAVCAASGVAQAVVLSGTVTRTGDGTPIQGAIVTAGDSFSPSVETTTNAAGVYSFEFTCVLSCVVGATLDGYVSESRSFPSNATSVVNDFALAVEATIEGRITLPSGSAAMTDRPLLERFDPDRGEWINPVAARSGVSGDTYHFTKLHAGIYRVCYYDPAIVRQCYDGLDQGPFVDFDYTPIELAPGDTRANVNFSPGAGSTISGHLLDGYANTNLADLRAYVSVFDEHGGQMDYPREVLTDAQGRYSIGGLAPGNYLLMATNGGFLSRVYPNGNCDHDDCDPLVQGTPVTVPPGGATNIDFEFQPHSVVRARVVDAVDGSEITAATFASWTWAPIFGVEPVSRHWYDASNGEYVSYNSANGGRVGATAPGYVARFVVGGNCPDLTACASSANRTLVQPRGDVRHVELRLSRADDYLFADGFE